MNEANASGRKLIEIFNEAKVQPGGRQREEFLAEACRGEAALREEVEELLLADTAAAGFLNLGPNVAAKLEAEIARLKPEEAGDQIGHYKLLQQIGAGGFGTVWMAEQSEPVKRRVKDVFVSFQ